MKKKKTSYLVPLLLIGFLCFTAYQMYAKFAFSHQLKENYQTYVLEQNAESLARNNDNRKESIIETGDIKELKLVPKGYAPDLDMTIGALHIPQLNLTMPVFDGTTKDQLHSGAVLLKSSDDLHKLNVLIGALSIKDSNTLFTRLLKAEEGMEVYVTDKQRITYYVIEKTAKIREGRTDMVLPFDYSTLRLITGYEDNGKDYHFVVHAKQIYQDTYSPENVGQLFDVFSY